MNTVTSTHTIIGTSSIIWKPPTIHKIKSTVWNIYCMKHEINFQRFRASCIESGSFLPSVSGRKMKTRMPPRKEPAPITRSGSGAHTVLSIAICGRRFKVVEASP